MSIIIIDIEASSRQASNDPNKDATLKPPKLNPSDKVVYFASPSTVSNPLIDFYAETYTLFQSLQRIVATGYKMSSPDIIDGRLDTLLGPPGTETIGHMSRLMGMYEDEAEKLRDNEQAEVGVV